MPVIERPRLRHCTLIDEPEGRETRLVVGASHFVLERIAGRREDLLRLKSYLDGRHTIDEIAARCELSSDDVTAVVEAFAAQGLLQQRRPLGSIPVGDFLSSVGDSTLMWRRQIGLHPLFARLRAGELRPEVFAGLLLETWHYVRMLPPMLASVAGTLTQYRDVILAYAEAEMDHHRLCRTGLETIPRLAGHVDSAHPTIGTLCLLRNFEAITRSSGLSALCCLQFVEARADEAGAATADLAAIAQLYGMSSAAEPFIAHMQADLVHGHASILAEALAGAKTIGADEAHQAINDLHDLKHCFDVFHDAVLSYYGDVSNYIPRPRVDYFAL
jgi:hypothetical protein